MRRLATFLLLALPLLPVAGRAALAEDEAKTTCDLHALVDQDDAGLIATYDGLRKGLELAHLPRVCRHDPDEKTGGIAGFVERTAMASAPLREAGKRVEPLFAVGDLSCAAVQQTNTQHPCVMVVTRYTAKRKPLLALPTPRQGTVVYADLPVERIHQLVRALLPGRAGLPTAAQAPALLTTGAESADEADVRGFEAGYAGNLVIDRTDFTGLVITGADEPSADHYALLLLHTDPRHAGPPFERALRFSRKHKHPLISDNRAHFGLGAVVVIVPRHDLLGRAAADEARKMRADPAYKPKPRAVPGMEIWVDLEAADAIGFELPLSFLARADRLRRGRKAAPKKAAPKKAPR